MKKYIFLLISCFLQTFIFTQVLSEKASTTNSLFQKIKRDSISHVILTTDYDSLLQGRRINDYPKMKATIIFKNANKADTIGVKVTLRGWCSLEYRRRE